VNPFDKACVQPASYDIHLSASFRTFRRPTPFYSNRFVIDPSNLPLPLTREFEAPAYTLYPGVFLLGSTVETVNIPPNMVARVEGKSSLGRLGLLVHITAGFIDPGFRGTLTLELYNCNQNPILLREGMRIAQLSFETLTRRAAKPYGHKDLGSHYQNQNGATESRYEIH
jgi:dCTP deaminase